MSNKREISVQINVGAKLENAQKRISNLQDQLNKLNIPASVRGEFSGLFATMEKEIDKLTQKTAGGKLKFIDNAAVEKSMDKIDSLYSVLIQKLESRGIAAAGLKQDQVVFSAIQGAMKSYETAMKGVAAEESKINAELDKQYKAKEKLLAQQKEQKIVTEAEKAAQEERVKAAKKEERDAEKRVKEARLALEKRISESSTYTKEDIDKKGSGLRKTKEFRAYKEASNQYAEAKKNKKTEEGTLQNMATLNEQKKALTEIELKIDGVKRKLEEFNSTLKTEKEAAAFEQIKKQLQEIEGIDLSSYGINLEEIKSVEDLEAALEKLNKVSKENAKMAEKQVANGIKEMGAAYDDLGDDIKQATDENRRFNDQIARTDAVSAKIKSFLGLSGAINTLKTAFRDAFSTIKELDATMTEMAVVTDLSVGDYWKQLPEYSKQASDLGVSINDAYKAATLYYQQGLKSNEVTKISAQTLKMARISGLSAKDATDKMTAALRGFNMEINEASAQRVADVYSELAAITAADVKEISSAMSKTASIASSAGMEFETTAAFLAQIVETTRESAETAGTALKTVIARFQELKKDPSEIGEIDGEIVDANKIETALRSVGVALRDSSGQFRDLDDVFMELSKKWNTLDTNTQRYIATIAAGSRQQSRFIAMMSDYNRTQELVTAANNSAGASQEQFNKTLEGVEAKLAKLKVAWDEFTMGILNSDLVKVGIDILTNFLEIINKAQKKLKGLGGSLVKISSIVAVFKLGQKIFEKFSGGFINMFTKVTEEAYKGGYNAMTAFQRGLNDAQNGPQGAGMQTGDQSGSINKAEENQQGKQQNAGFFGVKGGYHRAKTASAEYNRLKSIKADTQGYNTNKLKVENIERNYTIDDKGNVFHKTSGQKVNDQKASQIKNTYKQATQAVKEYENAETLMAQASQEKWSGISSAISGAGQAITVVGAGLSMLGGLLEQLGLEEAGEALEGIGAGVSVVGSGISMLGPIISFINTLAGVLEISFAACAASVALIAVGVIGLVAIIYAIVTQIQENLPEAKLKKVQENADAAAEAAENAKSAFEELSGAVDSLDGKQKALKELTRGTTEWNNAVQDVNASVLDLIEKYPELAGFVENEGGVLTIDVESANVQAVIKDYEKTAVAAKGAEIASRAAVDKQIEENKLTNISDAVFDSFVTNRDEAKAMADTNFWSAVGAMTLSGAAIGAGIGTATGAAAGGIGALPGAGVGALIGLGSGFVTGIATGAAGYQYTMDQVEKRDEKNRENVKTLAQAYANGETGESFGDVVKYINEKMGITGDAADEMARALLDNSTELAAYGASLNIAQQKQDAYYQAMAMNAQQLLDLGQYTEQQTAQINTVFDEDLMKSYEEERRAELEALKQKNTDDSNNTEFEEEKKAFVEKQYGSNAKIEGNKILNEKGETIREFSDDQAWITEMAAAEATLAAAEGMKEIPGIILSNMKIAMKEFGVSSQKALEKAFSGKDLTESELTDFKKTLGDVSYKGASWESLSEQDKAVWDNNKDKYLNSLDKDYSGIKAMWDDMSDSQKAAYGWDSKDASTWDKALNNFEDTFLEIIKEQEDAWKKANEYVDELELTTGISNRLDAKAAESWFAGLKSISAPGRDSDGLNKELNELLASFESAEDASAAMAQINAIDKMDIGAWEGLADTFKEMGLSFNTNALQEFIDKGIEVSGAIRKIDFSNLHNQINETYKLLDKVKKGGRVYSEKDYKELISSNKDLKDSFKQIGDQFYYLGDSMLTLEEAVRDNTSALLREANQQLKDKIALATIFDSRDDSFGSVESMDRNQLINFLDSMRLGASAGGLDLSALGLAGLTNLTSFSGATDEQLKEWAQGIVSIVGSKDTMEKEYSKNLYDADVQVYAQENSAAYNAQQAAKLEDDNSKKYQDALLLQAIQSGGVSNTLISQYKAAIEGGKDDEVERIGRIIANNIDRIIEDDQNRAAYSDLVDRVTQAIIDNRQKEIDKLSDINDSITSANEKLLGKIQEQIDADRQERENEKAKQNISDLYSQRAYLSQDTSGANALEILDLDAQIAEEEQNYQDSLIDQSLQRLEDANAAAAEQREKQIALLESQLQADEENGRLSYEAMNIVKNGIKEIENGIPIDQTGLGAVLFGSEGGNLSPLAKDDWASTLQQTATKASNWLNRELGIKDTGSENTNEDENSLDSILQNIDIGQGFAQNHGFSSFSEVKRFYNQEREDYIAKGGDGEEFDRQLEDKWNTFDAEFKTSVADRKAVRKSEALQGVIDKLGGSANNTISASDYREARANYRDYIDPNKSVQEQDAEFDQKVQESIVSGSIDGFKIEGLNSLGHYWRPTDDVTGTFPGGKSYTLGVSHEVGEGVDFGAKLNELVGGSPSNGWVAMYNKIPYVYVGGNRNAWYQLSSEGSDFSKEYLEKLRSRIAFKTGGLADFTGPAWLDGTKSRPEIVLNQRDSANFIQLRDILSDALSSTSCAKHEKQEKGGDNLFEIEINIEKVESDYDVEQMANKIRSMIYEDATYRNVNAINLIR